MSEQDSFIQGLRSSRLRQLKLLDPARVYNKEILIVGAGNVGSWTSMWLAKMGFLTIKAIDFDKVELHNTGSQIYGINELGNYKTIALGKRLLADCPELLFTSYARAFESTDLRGSAIVVMSVDSMATRRQIVESYKAEDSVELFVDSRVGRYMIRVIAFKPEEISWYLNSTWFEDSSAEDIPCGEQSIIDVQAFASGFVARQVRRFMTTGSVDRDLIFDVDNLGLITNLEFLSPIKGVEI